MLLQNTYNSLEQVATLNSSWFRSQFEHEENAISIAAEAIGAAEDYYLKNDGYMMQFLQAVCDNSNFQRVVFSNLSGNQLTNLGETSNASDREYFIDALNGNPGISNPFVSRYTNERCVAVSYPVVQNLKVVGVIHGAYYIDSVNSLFIDNEYSSDTYGYVTQINGTIILQSSHKNRLSNEQNLFTFFDDAKFDDGFSAVKLRTAISHGESGTFGYELDGNHRYISFLPIGINDWYSFTATTGEIATKSFDEIRNIMIVTTLKLILISILVATLVFAFKLKSERVVNKLNKELMNEIERAYFDPVTEHDNYFRFRMKAGELFKNCPEKKYVVIYTNIKNFKYINDAFGFETGNRVLRKSIDWLKKSNAILYSRVSADGFVSLKEYENEETVRLESVAAPTLEFDVSGIEDGLANVIVHAGIYCAPPNCDLALEAMIDRARLALNKARNVLPSGAVIYDESMRFSMLETQRMENKMKASLENNEFKVFLQPKINICENKIVACEALARWEDPERGLVSPASFVPVFERNGFIKYLDLYMFRTVCKIMRGWMDEGSKTVPVSVNVSKALINTESFIRDYIAIKNEYGIPDGMIEVEFTESVINDNKVRINEVLVEFRKHGILCAIDDFGAGYSSLNLLKDMPADVLKIDKAFFDRSAYSDREKVIIKNVVSMAKELSMQIVAEGVEYKEQVDFLRSVDCLIVQGFVFDRPMSVAAFEKKYLDIRR